MKAPLFKKLGIKPGFRLLILNSPKNYVTFFDDFHEDVVFINNDKVDSAQIFVRTLSELELYFEIAKKQIKKDGMFWIAWPKKSSKIKSELDKFSVKKYGLDHGLVDVKIASIDENWSALKFVYRLKDR